MFGLLDLAAEVYDVQHASLTDLAALRRMVDVVRADTGQRQVTVALLAHAYRRLHRVPADAPVSMGQLRAMLGQVQQAKAARPGRRLRYADLDHLAWTQDRVARVGRYRRRAHAGRRAAGPVDPGSAGWPGHRRGPGRGAGFA
jgi:hypothetical protein